jgi:predicted MFS family arabinose efflux permease
VEYSRRYENTLVAVLFFTWGTVFLDRMSQLYLAPFFGPEFQLTNQQIGLLAAGLSIAWALSALLLAALSDRLGRRPVLIPALFLFAVLSGLSGQARNFEQLLLIRILVGAVAGPAWSIMTAVLEESSAPSRRGRNVGMVVSAAALVGLAVAPVMATQVAARFGWRSAFLVPGGLGILMACLVFKFVKEPQGESAGGAHHSRPTAADYLSLLGFRNVWLACLGSGAYIGWLVLQNAFAPLYITNVVHQSATTAGFLLGASGLGSFFLCFLFPPLSDRIGRKPTLLILALLSTVVPVALQIPVLYSHLWLLAGILFVTNCGQAIGSLIIVLVPAESVPPQIAATAIGLCTLVGEILGGTLSPAVGGAMAEKFGLRVPLLMSAGATVVLFILALFLKPSRRMTPSPMDPSTAIAGTHRPHTAGL